MIPYSEVDPAYTFDNFAMGENNIFAYAAALKAADDIGSSKDSRKPLFIYGPSGLGKSHLMHAIAHRALDSGLKVACLDTSVLFQEVSSSFSDRSQDPYAKYAEADLLALDDVHVLAGGKRKDWMREYFLKMIKPFLLNGRQLVVTSNLPLEEIVNAGPILEKIQRGSLVRLDKTDMEARLSLARRAGEGYLDERTVGLIAKTTGRPSYCPVEGAATNIVIYEGMGNDKVITEEQLRGLEFVSEYLDAPIEQTSKAIVSYIANRKDMSTRDLILGTKRNHTFIRNIAMYLYRKCGHSFPVVGKAFGKSHSTALKAERDIEDAMTSNGEVRDFVYSSANDLGIDL